MVGCRYSNDWVRGKVTGDGGILSLVDLATFLRCSAQVKKLPMEFVQVPHMGVVFSVIPSDQDMFNRIHVSKSLYSILFIDDESSSNNEFLEYLKPVL